MEGSWSQDLSPDTIAGSGGQRTVAETPGAEPWSQREAGPAAQEPPWKNQCCRLCVHIPDDSLTRVTEGKAEKAVLQLGEDRQGRS